MNHPSARPSQTLRPRREPRRALCALALAMAPAWGAVAQESVRDLVPGPSPRWALVLDDATVLGVRSVGRLSDRGSAVTLTDGSAAALPPGRVLGLVPIEWADTETGAARRDWDARDLPGLDGTPLPARARFELVDGAVILGAVSRSAGHPDAVAIETDSVGTLTVPLERLRAIRMPGFRARSQNALAPAPAPSSGPAEPGQTQPARPVQAAQRDAVTLTNGDRLEGFVQGIGIGLGSPGAEGEPGRVLRPEPSVEVDTGRRVESVPLSLVAEVALANPAAEPSGPRLWTSDGGVLPIDEADMIKASQVRLRLRTGPAAFTQYDFPSNQARALVLDSARLVGLARLALAQERSLAGRPWPGRVSVEPTDGQIVSAATVRVPGEMEAEWDLPPGAAWFSAGVLIPASDRVLGQSAVRVSVGVPADTGDDGLTWRPLGELRLDGSAPQGRLRVPLGVAQGLGVPAGSRLRVSVTGGAAGVVQSGVELRRALITVAGPPAP